MSLPRFYVPSLDTQLSFLLEGEEATHAIRSLRFKIGDQLIAFNGLGIQVLAEACSIDRKSIECRVVQRESLAGELPGEVTLAIALPKGDRQRLVIEKLVEFGIHRLVPIETARSIAEGTESAIARCHRYSIEASKQCGRNRLLTIEPPRKFGQYLTELRSINDPFWFAHPYCGGISSTPLSLDLIANRMTFLIGPEGGFSDDEVTMALSHGGRSLKLGPRILRVESAVAYLCSIANMILDPPTTEKEA